MFTYLREACRRAFFPTYEETLSPLERKIKACFEENRTPGVASILIYQTSEKDEELQAVCVMDRESAKTVQAKNCGTGRMIAALRANDSFEDQWPLKVGLLQDLAVLVRYPCIRVGELQPKQQVLEPLRPVR